MVISAILRERNRKKDLEEGRQAGLKEGLNEGRAEVQSLWEAWNLRREEAAALGEPFEEPPPGSNHHNVATG